MGLITSTHHINFVFATHAVDIPDIVCRSNISGENESNQVYGSVVPVCLADALEKSKN